MKTKKIKAKRMRVKKLWILTLTVVVLATLFAGCNKQEGSKSEKEEMFVGLSTTDLEGNEVDDSIFAENDLTLINAWATWCSPCVNELPELSELNQELQKEGIKVGIKGLVMETDKAQLKVGLSDGERENANYILEKTGASYQQLLVSEKLAASPLQEQTGFPTTYFVDKNGKLVGEPISGAKDKDEWRSIIEKKLKEIE